MPQSGSKYYYVTFVFSYEYRVQYKMYHKDWKHLQEAITDGREWFMFPTAGIDTNWIHLSDVLTIHKEPTDKAF